MILKLTVKNFEGKNAVLTTEDGQLVQWPESKLPKVKIGSQLLVAIINEEKSQSGRDLAKNILNELLS
jgi:hypothetical protein